MNKKMMFLAPGMVLGAMVAAAQPQMLQSSDRTETRVNVGRQQSLFESDKLMRQANALALDGNFDGAIAGYRAVIQKLEPLKNGASFQERIAVCQKRITECYMSKAEAAMKHADDMATANDFEAAIKVCREAQRYCPEKKDALDKKIAFYETRRKAAVIRENSSIAKLAPNRSVQEYNIQLLIEQGRSMLGRNELAQARRKFEEVLLIDPFNADAIQNLEGINNRIRKDAKLRANATARRMVAKVEWDATIPIVADAAVGEPENQLDTPVAKENESPLVKKLKSIIIPRLNVEDNEITFSQLMQDIQRDCLVNDKEKRGVNFVVRYNPVPEGQEEGYLKAFSKEKISVYSLLEDLQNAGVLKFKIANNAVLVAQAGQQLEEMDVKYFSFELKADDTAESLKSYLSESIPFGEGTSVDILRARNLVIVRNTPENLKKVGAALEDIREAEPMVQVMFKFIEVNQDDLDELGFNWAYTRFNSDGSTKFSTNTNKLLRHYYTDRGRYEGGSQEFAGGGGADDRTLGINWGDSKNALSFGVYALDWADSSDVLYSPRVTTLSGTTAKIDMSEKHYYPDEWETIDSETTNGWRIEATPQPSLDDEQLTGITFEVTPQADRKTGLISVPIDIPVRQFAGWLKVDTRNGTDDDDGEYVQKPILSERSIKTSVTVKDGDTVLIGGMTIDNSSSIDDKVPILGDLPFIGRFFQSKYVKSQKSNLLVFMTCRMVRPDGSAINPKGQSNGLMEFPRNY